MRPIAHQVRPGGAILARPRRIILATLALRSPNAAIKECDDANGYIDILDQ
jgi:hypothetical protein